MTQKWVDDKVVPVTVLRVEPMRIVQIKTTERDGYTALQVTQGHRDAKKLTKPVAGQLKDLPRVRDIREFRLEDVDGYTVGQELKVGEIFAEGELVDVTGVSKGQGFAGTVKRHNFSRGPKTHGSDNYRKPGSIGPGTTPGRVYKGLKMGGHMGHDRVTIKKLRVIRVDAERNLILVKGSVPGAPGALTFVKKA
jgi:large subunit ribosomal protein L3